MTIYDISREVFTAPVYPGDPVALVKRIADIRTGSEYNLSHIEMGSHTATHIDAPAHFYEDGDTIEKVRLDYCIGWCTVAEFNDAITGSMIDDILPDIKPRLLIKGRGILTESAAFALRDAGIKLIGVETLSVGEAQTSRAIHLELLGAGIVLLESLNLSRVPEGDYFLVAPPVKLGGCDGAPCRAVLLAGLID